MLALATDDDLSRLRPSLLDLLDTHQHRSLGASFAMLHLLDRMPDLTFSSLSVPLNPYIAAAYLSTAAPVSLGLAPFWRLLDFPNVNVQRLAGRILSRHISDRGNLARQIFATLVGGDSPLFDGIPCVNEDLRCAGLIEMLHSLCDVEVPAAEYFDALAAVMRRSDRRHAAIAAQLLLARLLGPEFHCFDVVGIAEVQAERQRLEPAFAEAVLRVFGLCGVRRLALKQLPLFIEKFDDGGRPLVAVVVPYLRYFPVQAQFKLHDFLVGPGERRRVDSELFELTVSAIRESAPAVSPSLGRFLEAARRSSRRAFVLAVLRPLLEPVGPAPKTPLSGLILLPAESKAAAETQASPECVGTAVQTD
jgi:hypothetical protein